VEIINQLAAVLTVLGLLGGLAWWARRRNGFVRPALLNRKSARYMESVERLSLGNQQTLHLVRVGNKALLVAASGSTCALIDSADWRTLERSGENA
jgi:flagellar biosynthetic protein FliO